MTIAAMERMYPLGHSPSELKRLNTQAGFCNPFTRMMFQSAGLAPGMSVLDVGSGAGDVAILAAQIVGPGGVVVGSDRSPTAIDAAARRCHDLQLSNVRFVKGDPAEMDFEAPFDAIVGRSVLMYYRDPAETLRKLASKLKPGGIIAFQEIDCGSARAVPRLALYDKHEELVSKTLTLAGTDLNMGSKLYAALGMAGFHSPSMRVNTPIVGAHDAEAPGACYVLAEVLRSIQPLMEKFGVITDSELQIDTFAPRLYDELQAGGGVMIWNSIISAWAHKKTDGAAIQ